MKWNKPTVEDITPNYYDFISNLRHIERCGRVCYNSLDKMGEDTYEKFYNTIIPKDRNDPNLRPCDFHLSVLEHATAYLVIKPEIVAELELVDFFIHNEYSVVTCHNVEIVHSYKMCHPLLNTEYFITTNHRVVYENRLQDLIEQYRVNEPSEYHELRKTFVINTGIDITREFNRHRKLSISESSTRYIDPTLPRHGGQISFNDFETGENTLIFVDAVKEAESAYKELRKLGVKPQIARKILPLGTSSTIVYTAFIKDWNKLLQLRSKKAGAKGVHPDAIIIADQIYDKIKDMH
jgi:thymidylate synthase complementing protein thyX